MTTMPSLLAPKLRVLVVDDSSICRSVLRAVLEMDGDIVVVGEGTDAFSAVSLVETLLPDLVTMDVRMPGKSGLEAVEEIMSRRPVPILVVTTEALTDDAGIAFGAIENGALEITAKPAITDASAGAALRTLVRQLARTPVFQRAIENLELTLRPPARPGAELLVLIAGRGGMPSVMGLLSGLSGSKVPPIIVHQPLVEEQAGAYVGHLAALSRFRTTLAVESTETCSAGVLVVANRRAIVTGKGTLQLEAGEPNASALLQSIAAVYRKGAVAVVLAGKGRDGVAGLGSLRHEGALVYAESPLSATINELPLAAVNANLVDGAYPIMQLADQLRVVFEFA